MDLSLSLREMRTTQVQGEKLDRRCKDRGFIDKDRIFLVSNPKELLLTDSYRKWRENDLVLFIRMKLLSIWPGWRSVDRSAVSVGVRRVNVLMIPEIQTRQNHQFSGVQPVDCFRMSTTPSGYSRIGGYTCRVLGSWRRYSRSEAVQCYIQCYNRCYTAPRCPGSAQRRSIDVEKMCSASRETVTGGEKVGLLTEDWMIWPVVGRSQTKRR